MSQIELWKDIPEDFLIPDLQKKVQCDICSDIFTIVYTWSGAEITHNDISYSAKDSNSHGDMYITSSNNTQTLMLQQRNELGFFILLLKYASEIWILDDIVSPDLWNLLGYLNVYNKDASTDYINDFDMMFVNFSESLPKSENDEIAFSLGKTPHASRNRYFPHISEQKVLILTDNIWNSYHIHQHEVLQYMRLLLLAADQYAGRTQHWRYLWVIKYIFSEAYAEEYGRYMS